jgi:outer membrane beta-barrel protein
MLAATFKTSKHYLYTFICFVLIASTLIYEGPAFGDAGDFKGYEIRVIRPRFMSKRNRLELGGQTSLIMNQAFIYTLMLSGLLDYHFSEMFAFELGAHYGFSIDKEDKRLLESEFDITTQILKTQYIVGGGLLWTPIYGKTQLPSGQVIYFDDFLVLQGAMTGIQYDYKQCGKNKNTVVQKTTDVPSPRVVSYPTLNVGLGQKYFLTEDFSLRWDARAYIFYYNSADGSCNPDSDGEQVRQENVTLSFGGSIFF